MHSVYEIRNLEALNNENGRDNLLFESGWWLIEEAITMKILSSETG